VGYDFDIEIGGRQEIRHIPPDVAAIRTWLFNRRPDKWRDRVEVTSTATLSDKTSIEIKRAMVAKMVEWGLVPIENVPPELLMAPQESSGT
jgi:hypothetical protein